MKKQTPLKGGPDLRIICVLQIIKVMLWHDHA